MIGSRKSGRPHFRIDRYIVVFFVIWTALVGLSLTWSLSGVRENVLHQALAQARGNLDKDIVYRRWATRHGGVYVPATDETPPNPYLSHVLERDIVTPSGRQLTLMNPSYILRQVHEVGQDRFGSRGHISSLNPINPRNAPDPWETEALRAFERGKAEVSSLETLDGKLFLRIMLPFVAEQGCLKCHAEQGYKEDDIRGGISLSIPFDPFLASGRRESSSLIVGHGILWMVGLVGIGYGGRRIRNHNLERDQYIERLRESEQALRLREAELKEAQRMAGIGNWVLDSETGEVTYSEELHRIFGTDPGLPPPNYEEHSKILTAASMDVLNVAIANTAKDGEPYDIELEILRPDGSRGWINARGEARRDNHGLIVGLRGTALDISERKNAKEQIQKGLKLEVALRKIDDRILRGASFREALDVACDAVMDLGYRMCWVGLTEPDFSVRPVTSRGFDEGYLDRMKFRWDETPEGMGPTGIAIRTGRTYVCRDILTNRKYAPWQEEATRRGYRSSVSLPLNSGEGETLGVLHVYSDTAERFTPHDVGVLEMFAQQCTVALVNAKRMEELKNLHDRLSMHMQRMPLGYIEHDAEFRIVGWNPASERIFGWTAEEMIGKHPFELIVPPKMHDHVRNLWSGLLEGYVSSDDSAGPAFRKDGTTVECEWFNTSLKDASGAMIGLYTLVHDISEKTRMEKQLQTAQRMESVGMLAGGIAHDFNNALTGIVGFGELLRMKLAGDVQGLHDLDEIMRCAERASTLTRQLLTYARRQVIEPVNMSLNAVVSGLMKLIGKTVGEHIEVTTSLGMYVSTIHADRGQIEQVIMNLCLNARDAMPDGGNLLVETENVVLGEDFVRYNPYMRTGSFVLLKVSDTGIGMDEKIRERVFDPFFTTKGPDKGTGLGLAMVYGIVKQHGGFIHLYSEPGKGTTFNVYFPAVEGRPDAITERDREEGIRGGRETILFAEDEDVIRILAERTLRDLGYRVLVARNGEEAIEIFSQNKEIVLAVLDLVMPKKGGKEAFQDMQRANPNLKVIFISGYAVNGIHESFVLTAGVPFLQKPFGPTILARKIREVLDSTD